MISEKAGYFMTELTFRFAVKEDVSTILYFIRQLAEYERMSNEVVATEELLEEWIFEKQKAEVLFAAFRETGKNPFCFEGEERAIRNYRTVSHRKWLIKKKARENQADTEK